MSAWTFDDRERLTAEVFAAGDHAMLARIWYSDEFEPSLELEPDGLASLLIRTPEEKREWRERVTRIFAEREAIKARWKAEAPAQSA